VAKPFRVIAHRGASAHAPENTLPAFELALERGAREIELDVRFSADLQMVVFHDDTLDRKTRWHGRVCHYSADELARVDVGEVFDARHPERERDFAGATIPRLEQVFAAVGERAHYHVELKGFDDLLPLRVMQAIDDFGLAERVTITSFSMKPLRQVRRLHPDVPICLLLRDVADALRSAEFRPQLIGATGVEIHAHWIEEAARAGFQQVGIRAADFRPGTTALAEGLGLSARGWGVESPELLEGLIDLGAFGATVDWPSLALEIVAAHEAAAGAGTS
jgi:glycerophosphoryl diester phosphodiesterase